MTEIKKWVLLLALVGFLNPLQAANLDNTTDKNLDKNPNKNAEKSTEKIAEKNKDKNSANTIIKNPSDQLTLNLIEKDAQTVLAQIELTKKLRAQLPDFVTQSNAAINQHKGALPAANTLQLAKGLAEANAVRNELFDQAIRHRSALYRTDLEISDNARVAEIVIAMASGVTLFDNNNVMRKTFEKSPLLKQKLNEGYPEFDIPKNYYDSSVVRSVNPEYRKSMRDALGFFADNKAVIEKQINLSTKSIQELYLVVANNKAMQQMSGGNVLKEIVILPIKALLGAKDLTDSSLGLVKFRTSQVVGNTMGAVRWRDGKFKGDANIIKTLYATLQPGDILLEKTPFTLTDKSIPGHFGHAAIYVGTAEQLKTMDMLNLPIVQKNLSKIKAGHVVVEALRNGVQLDSLQAFMNVDDVAILRPKNLNIDDRKQAVSLALGNLGKQYDFNFDVNTTEKIVCSELVYIVYPQVDFMAKNVMGSFAITPDDIAMHAGEKADPIEVILFAHNGKLVYPHADIALNEKGLQQYNTFVKPNIVKKAQKSNNPFTAFIHNF